MALEHPHDRLHPTSNPLIYVIPSPVTVNPSAKLVATVTKLVLVMKYVVYGVVNHPHVGHVASAWQVSWRSASHQQSFILL